MWIGIITIWGVRPKQETPAIVLVLFNARYLFGNSL